MFWQQYVKFYKYSKPKQRCCLRRKSPDSPKKKKILRLFILLNLGANSTCFVRRFQQQMINSLCLWLFSSIKLNALIYSFLYVKKLSGRCSKHTASSLPASCCLAFPRIHCQVVVLLFVLSPSVAAQCTVGLWLSSTVSWDSKGVFPWAAGANCVSSTGSLVMKMPFSNGSLFVQKGSLSVTILILEWHLCAMTWIKMCNAAGVP